MSGIDRERMRERADSLASVLVEVNRELRDLRSRFMVEGPSASDEDLAELVGRVMEAASVALHRSHDLGRLVSTAQMWPYGVPVAGLRPGGS
jgi:hypothetical protein